jgi:hypothetical protein
MRVVDHSLPARRRPRLLEVDAHGEAEVVLQVGREPGEPVRVVDGRLDVVDAARPDDHEQPVVLAAQDVDDLRAAAEHGRGLLARQRQVGEDLGRRLERHDALDPLVPNSFGVALHKGPHLASHCESRFLKSRWKSYVRTGAWNGVRGALEEYARQAAAGRTPS